MSSACFAGTGRAGGIQRSTSHSSVATFVAADVQVLEDPAAGVLEELPPEQLQASRRPSRRAALLRTPSSHTM